MTHSVTLYWTKINEKCLVISQPDFKTIVIWFDFFNKPTFQNIIGFDVFDDKKSAKDFILKNYGIIENKTRDGVAIFGLFAPETASQKNNNNNNYSILLITKARIILHSCVYEIESSEYISLIDGSKTANGPSGSFYFSYSSNLTSFLHDINFNYAYKEFKNENSFLDIQMKDNDSKDKVSIRKAIFPRLEYSWFYQNCYPFHKISERIDFDGYTICPIIIQGSFNVFQKDEFTSIIIFRRAVSCIDKTPGLRINSLSTKNQTEIELVFSKKSNICNGNFEKNEVSSYVFTFGSIPIEFRKIEENDTALDLSERNDFLFLRMPEFILKLRDSFPYLYNKRTLKIYLFNESSKLNSSNGFDPNKEMRSGVSFSKGYKEFTENLESYSFECNIKEFDKESRIIFDHFPELTPTTIIFLQNKFKMLNSQDKIIYISSEDGIQNIEIFLFFIIKKIFESYFQQNSISNEIQKDFNILSILQMLKDIFILNQSNDSSVLDFLANKYNFQMANYLKNEKINLNYPKNYEYCISLDPSVVIIENYDSSFLGQRIDPTLLFDSKNPQFLEYSEQSLVVCLPDEFSISTIIFSYDLNNRAESHFQQIKDKNKPLPQIPSYVYMYGGLLLNMMFPLSENISLFPNGTQTYHVLNPIDKDIFDKYCTTIKYSLYSKVKFIQFNFISPFKKFILPKIYIMTNDEKPLKLDVIMNSDDEETLQRMIQSDDSNSNPIHNEINRLKLNLTLSQYVSLKENKDFDNLFSMNSFYFDHAKLGPDLCDKCSQLFSSRCKVCSRGYCKKCSNAYTSPSTQFISRDMCKICLQTHTLLTAHKTKFINYEKKMILSQYPFLGYSISLQNSSFDQFYNGEIVIPYSVASAPLDLAKVLSNTNYKYSYQKSEYITDKSIVLLKLITLKNYDIKKVIISCKTPLIVEVLNLDNMNNKFLINPPSSSFSFNYNKRIIDFKIIGNPITLSQIILMGDNSSLQQETTIEKDKTRSESLLTFKYNMIEPSDFTIDYIRKKVTFSLKSSLSSSNSNLKSFVGLEFTSCLNLMPSIVLYNENSLYIESKYLQINDTLIIYFPEMLGDSKISVIFSDKIDSKKVALPKIKGIEKVLNMNQ